MSGYLRRLEGVGVSSRPAVRPDKICPSTARVARDPHSLQHLLGCIPDMLCAVVLSTCDGCWPAAIVDVSSHHAQLTATLMTASWVPWRCCRSFQNLTDEPNFLTNRLTNLLTNRQSWRCLQQTRREHLWTCSVLLFSFQPLCGLPGTSGSPAPNLGHLVHSCFPLLFCAFALFCLVLQYMLTCRSTPSLLVKL